MLPKSRVRYRTIPSLSNTRERDMDWRDNCRPTARGERVDAIIEWFNRTFWTSPVRARLPDFSDTLVISRALGLLIFWFNQPVRLSLIFNDVT